MRARVALAGRRGHLLPMLPLARALRDVDPDGLGVQADDLRLERLAPRSSA